MQCPGCRKELTDGVGVCLRCGTPVPRAFASVASAAPRPDPVVASGDNWPTYAPPPTSPYTSLPPPPPPPLFPALGYDATYTTAPRRALFPRRRPLLAALVALSLVAAVAGALTYVRAQGTPGTTGSDANLGHSPGSAAHTTCSPTRADSAAATTLRGVQLTSGLRNVDAKDYTPIDTTTTFSVGANAYIAFTIGNIASDGTLIADWCLDTTRETRHRTLVISNNDAGVQGYFSLSNLDTQAIGPGKVVLWWTDATGKEAVVAIQTFTVTAAPASTGH